jgi:hypothetical protein
MKQLLTILAALFLTASVYADCKSNLLRVFPTGKTIRQNSIFVLEGYAKSQKVIVELNSKYNIYLKSGQKKVKLLVTEICVGQFYLTQAVLRPETALEAGLEYTMYIDSLPKYEDLSIYNYKTNKHEPVTYKVIAGNDIDKPQLSARPIEIGKKLEHFGCGPAKSVIFSNPAKDNSEIIVKTTVKNLQTGKETTYYIKTDGDKINVGHGMCSGAFTYDDNDYYDIEFSFMDASGNLNAWTGERIEFTRPVKETE